MRRNDAGDLVPVDHEALMDEVAAKARATIEKYGKRSVALYIGTQAYRKSFNLSMAKQFMSSIDSDMIFSTMTIDQSAHWVADARFGLFATGKPGILESDVIVLVGTNPVVSHSGPYVAAPTVHQIPKLKAFQARGGKLIVVDPRITETARVADIHLQVRPGVDTELFAGLIRIVLENAWHDREFCDRWVTNLPELEHAVAPFTPGLVAERVGISAAQLMETAKVIAGARKLSIGFSTGVSMSPNPNTAAHMIEALNAICGGYLRAGDTYSNPGVFSKKSPVEAVVPPSRSWETGPKLGSGYGQLYGEFPSSRLPDEILNPGPSQIRMLIVLGANPMMAFGEPERMREALSALDCLVMLEPRTTETTVLADYVVAPPLQWEVADINLLVTDWVETPYLQFADPVVEPPVGTLTEWKFFNGVANRLGHVLRVKPFSFGGTLDPDAGTALTPDRDWETEELLDIALTEVGSSVAELRKHPDGYLVDPAPVTISAPEVDTGARLALCPSDVAAELQTIAGQAHTSTRKYRLISRRIVELMNSEFRESDKVIQRFGGAAPLFMHPDDMSDDSIERGDMVVIEGDHGKISARVRPDKTMRRGTLSMPHCWNGVAGAPSASGHTSWLVSMATADVQPIDGMPQQSSIPVDIHREAEPKVR
jgi:anaerobic selenocysteine-containing dehydrogenase